jgi:hypothetical protein
MAQRLLQGLDRAFNRGSRQHESLSFRNNESGSGLIEGYRVGIFFRAIRGAFRMRPIAALCCVVSLSGGIFMLNTGSAFSERRLDPTCTGDECRNERFAGTTCYMGECLDQYIVKVTGSSSGILQVLVKIRTFNAKNPKVTLGLPQYATSWVSCRSPGGYIEDERHVRIEEPNPQASHATEPAEKLWSAVCKR